MKRAYFLRFLAFLVIVQLLYFPLHKGGFVTDFTGLLDRYEGSTAWDILNSFGYPALQPVLNFFLYIFYHLFGTWGLPWYLVYSSVFALNAFLLSVIVSNLCQQFEVKDASLLEVCVACLFIITPYQVEVIYWRVLFNFLSVTTYILIALLFTIHYAKDAKRKYLLWIHIPFVLGLFTFELALMTPLFIGIYLLVLHRQNPTSTTLKKIAQWILLPQFFGIGIWLVLNSWLIGDITGHYGAETHLNFNAQIIISTFLKYAAKHLFLFRYLSIDSNSSYAILQTWWVILSFTIVVIGITMICVIKWKQLSSNWKLALLSFYWSGIALLPVLNLYFYNLQYFENDRYGYLGWAFFSMLVVLVLHQFLKNKWLFIAAVALYGTCHLYYTIRTVQWAKQATEVHDSLLANFNYADHSEVYLLGFADNFKGIFMFRDYTKSNRAFGDALKYVKATDQPPQLFEVAQFNMTASDNRLKATVDTLGRIRVTFDHWGSWWWRGGAGITNYETDKLKVEQKSLMLYVTPKSPAKDAIFLYQVGNTWQELEVLNGVEYQPIRPGPE